MTSLLPNRLSWIQDAPSLLAAAYLSRWGATPAVASAPGEAVEREALEVGGLLTVDAANRFQDWENTPAELGSVELSAKVHVHENMEAAITLLSESDPQQISIVQAVGEWRLAHGRLVFGQQYFNLGLLSTRTITDPLILDLGEFSGAGLTGLVTRGMTTIGVGITSLATGPDSALTHDPCFIANADLSPGSHTLRASSQLSKERIAINGAANLAFGTWLLDAEAIWRVRDIDAVSKGGYYVGLAFSPVEALQIGLRWDGLGDEGSALTHQRFGGGLTLTLVEHVFGSIEIAHDEVDGAVFAVQMGLQSTIHLPGFQRKTLVK
jgi:hypothetical protein